MVDDSVTGDPGNLATPDAHRVRVELERLQTGDRKALDDLLPLLFQNLRHIARGQRIRMQAGGTMCTTALVHEAYLKLRRSNQLQVASEHHFLNLAARAMRQILVDHARSRMAAQRRDKEAASASREYELRRTASELLELDEALQRLEPQDPRLAQTVIYRFFAGYTEAETADLLGISERTVRRDWLKAKAWLLNVLDNHDAATTES